MNHLYAIVDIETTGLGGPDGKITEIAIFLHNGKKVLDHYSTLINPERSIPPKITMLTGISNDMVAGAPKFYEVAKDIHQFTENAVIVAHNINFDYGFIRKEYRDLGFDFRRKRLCTLRLARKLMPGLRSYGLGNLCNALGIRIKNRHRAGGDAEATVILFERLLAADTRGFIAESLHPKSREATLPPNLAKEKFDSLPTTPGVYYFHDDKGQLIYIGKAINIRKRVLSHFRGGERKSQAMLRRIHDITFTPTGSELVALLLESHEIKKHRPLYNRAQKRVNDLYGLLSFEDQNGYLHIGYNHLKNMRHPLATFYNITETRSFIMRLASEFNLCHKLCGLQNTNSDCFNHRIKKCLGACTGAENSKSYNMRVLAALKTLENFSDSMMIIEQGRNSEEQAVILIDKGTYKGFAFIHKDEPVSGIEELRDLVRPMPDNKDIQRILRSYLRKNHDLNIIS